ncbi:MAG: DNA gyrase subunit A [Clostridia bacterium]|nr:DNA gyrase subunit A [Clostridia bacterium]MBQ8523855.1 DNA gyrase subunit A [Clostridia bacterium]
MADKHNKNDNIEFPEQVIVPIGMEKRVRKAFLEYSMSVIVSRALPDVRDGMKPGQRRIMYAMYEDNLTHDKPFRKSATTVGNVLGRYHPHGDSAVYGTMVRMAQDFSYRYPLIQGHGNFGSVDGDGAAAYRYTEARLAKISAELMADIEKNVIDWNMNFDNTRREPTVLPSKFPNLLVNGSIGIAVGMATNIPPHNLSEVVDGTIYLMDNPDAGVSELMKLIKGPDFPTAATVFGTRGIYEAYSTGRGKVMVRAKAEVDEEKRRIIISEIPYMVNKSELVKSMADQVRDKKVEGVTDIRDESGRGGMRIVIEYRRDANGQVILNQFYKYTQLQDTCAINMLALVNGEPKVLGLRQILGNYISHRKDVTRRRVQYDLDRALHEAHINEGYKIATDNIDEVITIIRNSPDTPTAKVRLSERFNLSDEQAQAIVSMTLGRLSGMERQKVEEKLVQLYADIKDYREILADPERIKGIIRDELLEIKAKYGDERKTSIEEYHDEIMLEDLIERHNCVITLTHAGYIKRQPADSYSAQSRGGKGRRGMATKEEDYIESVFSVDSHSNLLLFTNFGRVYTMKPYRVPEASYNAKGTNIVNLLELGEGEHLTAGISVESLASDKVQGDYLIMITKQGVIKRTLLSEFSYQRKGGKIAINLDEGDELIFAAHTSGDSDIMIATSTGLAARFPEEKVSVMGRTARGVRGIRLMGDDYVAGAVIIERDEEWRRSHRLIMITENGFGKRLDEAHFENKGRGIKGMCCYKITDRTGPLVGIETVSETDDVMMITNDGTIIRTPTVGIPEYGRTAAGVIVMRLSDDAKIVNFTVTAAATEEEAEVEASSEEAPTEE